MAIQLMETDEFKKPMRRSGLKAQLIRGGIAGFLVRGGAIFAGLVASVTLARTLGPDTYGVYAFVFAIITILGLPVKMGLPTLILRETARADQAFDGAIMSGIWRWSDRAIVFMAAIVLVLSGLYFWTVSGIETPRLSALLWALPLIPIIGLAEARAAAIRGLRRVALGSAPDKVIRPLLLAGAVASAALLFSEPLSAAQVYIIHSAVALVTLILAALILKRVRPRHAGEHAPRTNPRIWIAAILPLSAIAGLQLISQNTDILMLGSLATNADVGLYRVALSGANLTLFGLTTANIVLQPYFARAWGAADYRQLQKLATIGARISVLTTLPVLFLFFFLGSLLLEVIFGEAYSGAFGALVILCMSQVVSAFFGSVGNLLTMTGRERVALTGLAVSTVVNVVLNWILIPPYGIEGAAIATGISIAVWNAGLWAAALSLMQIDSSPLGLSRNKQNGRSHE